MNDIYLWFLTGISALLALNTLWRLWTDRERLFHEDLSDEDRSFAWRIVISLVFPFVTFLDLRATLAACELFGGYVKDWTYGLIWYHAIPQGLPSNQYLLPVYLAGLAVQLLFALCLFPSLFFRPHPFLATLIGYTVAFVLGLNLIFNPLLSLIGLGGPLWQTIFAQGINQQQIALVASLSLGALIYIATMTNQHVRMWFSGLTRPNASDRLKEALLDFRSLPDSPALICHLGLLYDKAGLRRKARLQLKDLSKKHSDSTFTSFLRAILAYRQRDYSTARQKFLTCADYPNVDGQLKADLLAASACASFADRNTTEALNLAERALEFDDNCLVARMIKVDVFLRQGKKERAGEELLLAMRHGLSLELEKKVPLDIDKAFQAISKIEAQPKACPLSKISIVSGNPNN